jgi:HEAT repeat protein
MWFRDLFRPNLAKLAEKQDISGLIEALSHREPIVQRQASTILRSMGKTSIPLLIDALQHGTPALQEQVTGVLEEIPGLPMETLITALGDDTGHTFPGVAALIAKMGDQVVLPLMGALNSGSEEVRKGAIVALGMIGEPARPQLLAALMHPSYRIRYGAALSLDRTGWVPQGDRERFRYLYATGQWQELVRMRKAAVPPLMGALDDGHYAVRKDAALALGSIGDLRAVDPLQRLLIIDPEEAVRAAAAEALGLLADDQAVPALRAAVHDHAHSVRMAAALALARINWIPDDEQEQLALLVATEQWSQLIRHGPAAVPVLITALGDEYYGIRTGAAEALWRIGDPAVDLLIQALRDQNPAIRAGATGVLMRLGAFPKERPAPTFIEQIRPDITPPLHIRREVQPETPLIEIFPGPEMTPPPSEAASVGDDLDHLLSSFGSPPAEEAGVEEPAVSEPLETMFDKGDLASSPPDADEEGADPVLAELDDNLLVDISSLLPPAEMAVEAQPLLDHPDEDDLSSLLGVLPSGTVPGEPPAEELPAENLHFKKSPHADMEEDTLRIDLSPIHPAEEWTEVEAAGPAPALMETAGIWEEEPVWAPVQESEFLSLMDALQRTSPDDDDDERSRLITSYLAGQPGALASDQPSVIVSAVGPALSAEDDAVRMVAAEVLGQIGVASVPLLIEALHDPYYQVRISAADALGRLGDTRALPLLIRLLLEDEEEEVRSRAAHALGELRDPAATGPLVRALHDRYSVVRGAAARALGMTRDQQAIGPLVTLFESGDRATAEAVIQALQAIGASDDLALMASASSEEEGRRRAAETLLTRISQEKAVLPPPPATLPGTPSASPVHEVTIVRPNPSAIEVTCLNPEALSVPGVPGALPEGSVPVPEDEFTVLIEASVHEQADIRRKVAQALGKSHDPRAGDLLTGLLIDQDELVRAAAAEALGLLGNPAAVTDLVDALKDQSDEVVMQAARSLGEIQDPAAAAPLIQLLNADDYGVMQVAGEALTALGAGATSALVEVLDDTVKEIRAGAAESLAAAGWIPGDTGEEVRYLIAQERWSEIGSSGENALPHLARLLDDPDQETRLGVVNALAKIGGSSAAALLERAAADPSYMVRKRAGLLLREESGVQQSEPEEPVPEIPREE